MKTWIQQNSLALVLGIVAGYCLFGRDALPPAENPLQAQVAVPAEATNWEYKTISIDRVSLPMTLTSMGSDGWEVFAVTPIDAALEGNAHVITQRLEVTAKRKKR